MTDKKIGNRKILKGQFICIFKEVSIIMDKKLFKKTYKFICSSCGEFSHTDREYCEICGEKFTTKRGKNIHMGQAHS